MSIFILCIVIVACGVEFYKKAIRGTVTEEGTKTKASRWEIYIIAFIFSVLSGLLFCKIETISNIWIYLLTVVSIYFLQYLLDMKVIKDALNILVKGFASKQ